MHEFLAIVKQIVAKRQVSFDCEVELISQLTTNKTNSICERMLLEQIKSESEGMLH